MTVILQAPVTVQLAISIINDETDQQAVATFSLAKGRFHTEESMREALKDFEEKHMPAGFRLMSKREWFNSQFGQVIDTDEDGDPIRMNVAMPGGENWAE